MIQWGIRLNLPDDEGLDKDEGETEDEDYDPASPLSRPRHIIHTLGRLRYGRVEGSIPSQTRSGWVLQRKWLGMVEQAPPIYFGQAEVWKG